LATDNFDLLDWDAFPPGVDVGSGRVAEEHVAEILARAKV
jgi:hypothetical protein